jgi:hypothetical protein
MENNEKLWTIRPSIDQGGSSGIWILEYKKVPITGIQHERVAQYIADACNAAGRLEEYLKA